MQEAFFSPEQRNAKRVVVGELSACSCLKPSPPPWEVVSGLSNCDFGGGWGWDGCKGRFGLSFFFFFPFFICFFFFKRGIDLGLSDRTGKMFVGRKIKECVKLRPTMFDDW